jgi:hypothetical protein
MECYLDRDLNGDRLSGGSLSRIEPPTPQDFDSLSFDTKTLVRTLYDSDSAGIAIRGNDCLKENVTFVLCFEGTFRICRFRAVLTGWKTYTTDSRMVGSVAVISQRDENTERDRESQQTSKSQPLDFSSHVHDLLTETDDDCCEHLLPVPRSGTTPLVRLHQIASDVIISGTKLQMLQ